MTSAHSTHIYSQHIRVPPRGTGTLLVDYLPADALAGQNADQVNENRALAMLHENIETQKPYAAGILYIAEDKEEFGGEEISSILLEQTENGKWERIDEIPSA